ncbi:hypothetical protein K505DRAFT_324099 [Melanomma pulvis-pyrius CBS 109.77]|uniref:Uncharacterized protein n=1 Tax=Melanomma pulvis-pyrius CBS 109.77 TaxID=1314802 RepID=A0A6A6XGI2_9PLEO|nr:hypothetical protein K505DRAFT_324099 [Melanomma pulvis-pyrius CBS 109.77]
MSHSWSGYIGGVFEAPDPVQAYFNMSSRLWKLNCIDDDASGRRCVSDCTNVSSITGSLAASNILWECALYPNVTNDFRLGILSEAQNASLITDHVDTSLAKAAAVTSTISSCLSAFCEGLEGCKQKSPHVCSASSLSINGSMVNMDTMDICIQSICTSHPQPLTNTDIAGIGIVSSYIIQIGIALLSPLALIILKYLWKAGSRHASTSCGSPIREAAELQAGTKGKDVKAPIKHQYKAIHGQRIEPLEGTEIQQALETQGDAEFEQATESQETSKAPKLYNALISALVEFLKAQCFLAIAVSTAALVVLNSQSQIGLLDATALGATSGISIIPITFNLYILATFNTDRNDPKRKSWYLYGLSLCCWILGLCVVLSPQMFKENKQNKSSQTSATTLFDSQYPNACGNASPINICPGSVPPDVHPEYAFYYTLCLPSMIGLTIWQLSTLSYISQPLSALFYKDSRPILLRFRLLHLFALGFFVAPFCFFFMSIYDLFKYDAVSFEWSFGQIIAIILIVTGFVNNLWDGVINTRTKSLPVGYSTR